MRVTETYLFSSIFNPDSIHATAPRGFAFDDLFSLAANSAWIMVRVGTISSYAFREAYSRVPQRKLTFTLLDLVDVHCVWLASSQQPRVSGLGLPVLHGIRIVFRSQLLQRKLRRTGFLASLFPFSNQESDCTVVRQINDANTISNGRPDLPWRVSLFQFESFMTSSMTS